MSVPGGPPKNGTKPGEAAPTYWRYYSHGQETTVYHQPFLRDLCDAILTPADRWTALVLLRMLQISFNGSNVSADQLRRLKNTPLGMKCKAVLRCPRLSEVSVQLGVASIAANPEHIDVDWYGYGPGAWWAGFSGREAERIAAIKHLNFLEDSFNLKRTKPGADPSTWSWGVPKNLKKDFVDRLQDSENVGRATDPAFADVRIEWHCGASPTNFTCAWTTAGAIATFSFYTPAPIGLDTV